jgi:hypothetical protein
MHRLCCYTLFDITQTGVMNRSRPNQDDIEGWLQKRNTQCNFDTILQVVSMRSQPEVVRFPTRIEMTDHEFNLFGFLYTPNEDTISYCWKFEFEVQHTSVFDKGTESLGSLYNDCNGVPMILCPNHADNLPAYMDTTEELKNIYFEVM